MDRERDFSLPTEPRASIGAQVFFGALLNQTYAPMRS
jgi:hypothetical protein